MGGTETFLNYVIPSLGAVIAMIMFSSPSMAVWKARQSGSIGNLNPLPFVVASANCVAWTSYSFLIDEWFLVIPNSLGCLIALSLFMVSYGLGMPHTGDRDKLSIVTVGLATVLFIVTIFERMVITSMESKKQLWGFTANTILFLYYLSPLSTVLRVLRQRDSSSLVLPLCLMNTLNGTLWLVYGLVLSDPFLWVPNGVGAILGGLQTALKLLIPSRPLLPSSSLTHLKTSLNGTGTPTVETT